MRNILRLMALFGVAILFTSCANRSSRDCCSGQVVVDETYIHKYGVRVPQNEWANRGKSGQVVSTLKNGVVVTKNFSSGRLEGDTTYTFPHGTAIERVETYEQGHLVKEIVNFPSGKPRKETALLDNGRTSIQTWYENGFPQCREVHENDRIVEGVYYSQSNQIESKIDLGNGQRINRDEFGQLISTDEIANGFLVGRSTYFPNGNPHEIIPYVRGKIKGQKKTFHPGGEPHTIEEWRDDKQEGKTVVFQNGEKVSRLTYKDGVKHGIEERFKDGEFVVEEITWKNGKRMGPSFARIGEQTIVSWYYDDREVSKGQFEQLTNPRYR